MRLKTINDRSPIPYKYRPYPRLKTCYHWDSWGLLIELWLDNWFWSPFGSPTFWVSPWPIFSGPASLRGLPGWSPGVGSQWSLELRHCDLCPRPGYGAGSFQWTVDCWCWKNMIFEPHYWPSCEKKTIEELKLLGKCLGIIGPCAQFTHFFWTG